MDCKCIYLSEEAICDASLSHMVPKLFDYDAYCTSEEHYRCPIRLQGADEGELKSLKQRPLKNSFTHFIQPLLAWIWQAIFFSFVIAANLR